MNLIKILFPIFNKLPQTMHADSALIIIIIMVLLNSRGNFSQSSHDQICSINFIHSNFSLKCLFYINKINDGSCPLGKLIIK